MMRPDSDFRSFSDEDEDDLDDDGGTPPRKWYVEPHPYSVDWDALVTDDDNKAREAAIEAIVSAWDKCKPGEEYVVRIARRAEQSPPGSERKEGRQ